MIAHYFSEKNLCCPRLLYMYLLKPRGDNKAYKHNQMDIFLYTTCISILRYT